MPTAVAAPMAPARIAPGAVRRIVRRRSSRHTPFQRIAEGDAKDRPYFAYRRERQHTFLLVRTQENLLVRTAHLAEFGLVADLACRASARCSDSRRASQPLIHRLTRYSRFSCR